MARVVVIMGVAGSGKTTVGHLVADALGVAFVDADDYHDDVAIARMRAGQPLDDDLRLPWLDRLHAVLVEHIDDGVVLACSALKASYRARLAQGIDDIVFVALVVTEAELARRLRNRVDHYAGPDLLASQLATLELSDDVVQVDGDADVDTVAQLVQRWIKVT